MTGTGVIPLAYHFETPVICSDLPAFHEVVKDQETGVIAKGQSSKNIADAIKQFQQLRTSVDFANNTRDLTQLFTWQKFCDELVAMYLGN
jgi:glycosyltransferase involved in cell wall biosynthesis